MTQMKRRSTSCEMLSLQEIKRMIDAVERHPLVVQERWYLICLKWWEALVEAIEQEDISDVPPIDNTKITIKKEDKFELKPNLMERLNYILVPEFVFSYLQTQFGVSLPDRDIIERYVISSKDVHVEIYPTIAKVALSKDMKNIKQLNLNLNHSFEQLKKRCLEIFELKPSEKINLYINQEGKYKELITNGVEWVNMISPDQLIIIDILDENGVGFMEGLSRRPRSLFGNSRPTFGEPYDKPLDDEMETMDESSTYNSNSERISPYGSNRITKPGVCGLENLGNTCFLNSAVQCLSNVHELTDHFLSGRYKEELNRTNVLGTKGKLAEAYAELLKRLWSGNLTVIEPRNFKTVIGEFAPRFSGYSQHDSQELLSFLLDGLHEDLNRVKNKPYRTDPVAGGEGRSDKIVANESWAAYQERNDSIIIDNMHGQLKSTVTCLNCRKVSITFDPFCFLSIPLPTKEKPIKLTVVFIPLSKTHRWAKFLLTISRLTTVKQIKELIKAQLNLEDCRMILIHSPKSEFDQLLDDNELFFDSNILIRTVIAWEVDKNDSGKENLIQVRNRIKGQAKSLMIPVFFSVADNQPIDQDYINDVVLLRLKTEFSKKKLIDFRRNFSVNSVSEESMHVNSNNFEDKNLETFYYSLKYSYGLRELELKDFPQNEKLTWPKEDDQGRRIITLTFFWKQAIFTDAEMEKLIDREINVLPAAKPRLSLYECIDLFTREETLDENNLCFCSNCKRHERANKKLDLWRLPKILIIHLKRFHHSRWSREKIETAVEIPIKDLNLSSRILNDEKSECIYDLIAVSSHFGNLNGGHYTAVAKNGNDWYNFDDSYVKPTNLMSSNIWKSGNAYIMIYRRPSLRCLQSRIEPNIEMEVEN